MILHFTNYRYLSARLGISFLWIESFRNSSTGIFGATGADEQAGIMPQNPQGQLASLASAIQTHIPHNAFIMDSKGMIWIPMFWRAHLTVLWRLKNYLESRGEVPDTSKKPQKPINVFEKEN